VTEQGVGTNRYAYANNDPVNKFDPEGNSWISNIIGIALSFIPGLQPAGAALIAAGLSAVETVAAGGDLGDALKSATLTFATTLAMHNIQEGVFGRAEALDSEQPNLSTRGRSRRGGGSPTSEGLRDQANRLSNDIRILETQVYGSPSGQIQPRDWRPTQQTVQRLLIRRNYLQGRVSEEVWRATAHHQIRGDQVSFLTSGGVRTRVDFVLSGRRIVEVKSHFGVALSPGQQALQQDIFLGRAVTPVGHNAVLARLIPGRPYIFNSFTVVSPP